MSEQSRHSHDSDYQNYRFSQGSVSAGSDLSDEPEVKVYSHVNFEDIKKAQSDRLQFQSFSFGGDDNKTILQLRIK